MSRQATLWPELDYPAWSETCETLHLWTQVVGKIKLALCKPESHWWHVAFHVTARGLWSGPMPYKDIVFEIEFDLLRHELNVFTSTGEARSFRLDAMSVQAFYHKLFALLGELDIDVTIDRMPREVADPIAFDEDLIHASYDAASVERFRMVLIQCDRLLRAYRAGFCGRSSAVLFFWGSFDLTVVRFSGRVVEQAGSGESTAEVDEEMAVGFWPGSPRYPKPAFYAYAIPAPSGYYTSRIEPSPAHFDATLGEFIMDYADVRSAADPAALISRFFDSSYDLAATLGHWDRDLLERVVLEPIEN